MHGPVDTKMCSRCLHVKPVADFYREGNSGKHRYECKTCDYERWKIWFSQPHNRKKKSAWLRRYYLQHYEEALAKRRKYHRGYYLKNRETLHLKHRNYRTSPRGREVSRELTKKWKARVRGATQTPFALTLEQWKGLLQEFGHACAWCGASFTDRNRPEQAISFLCPRAAAMRWTTSSPLADPAMRDGETRKSPSRPLGLPFIERDRHNRSRCDRGREEHLVFWLQKSAY